MARKTKKRKSAQKGSPQPANTSRRSALVYLRNGAIAAAALGGAGIWTVRSVQAMAAERDLTRIGQGKPVIVQVHDPQCSTCTALQRETRRALKQFGECDLVYLVADITQPDGGRFARRYGVPHVTLLLFDGEGSLRDTVHGMHSRAELRPILASHVEAFGAAS
ncbi:MAG: thioredoxin family protein [Pseudomonadota bacterium]